MYSVLIGVDKDTSRAREQAEAIASLPGASEEVTALVFHVFEENPEGASASQLRSVREVINRLEAANVDHEIVERSGDPVEELLSEASRRDVDAICVGARNRSPTGKALFGSVAQQILLESNRPVIVIVDEA